MLRVTGTSGEAVDFAPFPWEDVIIDAALTPHLDTSGRLRLAGPIVSVHARLLRRSRPATKPSTLRALHPRAASAPCLYAMRLCNASAQRRPLPVANSLAITSASCASARAVLDEVVDGNLAPHVWLNEHLSACAACANVLHAMQSMRERLHVLASNDAVRDADSAHALRERVGAMMRDRDVLGRSFT